jgi:transposase
VLAALLPGVIKAHPVVDGLRLQVGALVPAAALAGLGAAAALRAPLPARLPPALARALAPARPRAAALAAAAALLAAPGLLAARAVPAVTAEWHLLRAALPAVPAGARLRFTPRTAHAEKTGALLAFLAPHATVLPLDGPPAPGDLVWVGLLCRSAWAPPGHPGDDPCAPVRAGLCPLEPLHTAAVPWRVDIDLHRALTAAGAPDPLDLGLYRAGDCRPAAAPAGPPPG